MLTTIPPTLHGPGRPETPAPGSPERTFVASSSPSPSSPSSCSSSPSPSSSSTPLPSLPPPTPLSLPRPPPPSQPPPPKPPLGAALPRRPAGRQLCDVTGATKAPRRPTRASPTKLHQATRPTASGGRSRCLAAPGPSAPRRGAPPPPGHASASPRLAKALLHRALGQATSRTDRGRHSSASHPSRPLCIVAQLCVATQGAY